MAQLKDLIVNGPSRFIGDVYATTFTGNLEGNANTATNATNAGMIAGLSVHSGRNNEANKIVRTDENGYLQVGYINSSSGHEKNASNPTYVWGSNSSDSYLRSYQTSSLSVSYATTSGSCSGNAASSIQSLLLSSTSDAKGALGVYFHRDFSITSLVGNTEGNGVWGHPGDSQDARYGHASILRIGWATAYYTDIFTGPNIASGKYGLQWRQIVNGTANDWKMLLDSSNYNYYALPLSGGTMSNTNVVTNLNADLLDGLHASSFSLAEHTHSQYLTSALIPAKLARKETYPPGYFIIKINNNNSEWMLSFDVKIVVTDGSYTIRFSEDNRSMSKSWSSPSASMIDGEDSVEVKFGYSQTNKWVAILIPESYVGISITNVANGYAPIDTYALNKLFSIDFYMDDVLQYLGTVQKTITIYPPSKEGHTHTFASLTSKPTTISGYGITDAYTKTQTDTKLSGYLLLSGGTLTGSVTMQGMNTNLIRNITYTSTSSWARGLITLQVDGVHKFGISALGDYTAGASDNGIQYGFIGCNSYDGLNLRISATSLSWGDSPILHAGNYNSYAPKLDGTGASGTWGINISGDANTLDGYHADSFTKKLYLGTTDLDSIGDSLFGQQTGWVNATPESHYPVQEGGGLISILSAKNSTNQIYGTHSSNRWFARGAGSGVSSRTSWREFAFLDSNVASATKLATSRTIWGQSFDGTGNVSGSLTGSNFSLVNSASNPYLQLTDSYGKVYFQIVNGDAYIGSTYSKSLMVDGEGNVGIGTTSPSYKLHVVGTAYASGGLVSDGPVKVNESFVVDGTNGSWYGKLNIADEVYILGEDTNINFIESLNIKQHNTTNNTETSIVSIDNSGNITLNVMNNNGGSYEISTRSGALGIGIPSDDPNIVRTPSFLMSNRGYIYINASLPSSPNYPLVVNGTIQCTTLSQTSDIKYKSNIKQIKYEEALKIIENLNPVTWDWNENTVETGSSSGFVAQEAEEFIPNAISRDNENNLSLDYTQLHSYEIRVIQEQQKEIIKLKEKLKILENLIS